MIFRYARHTNQLEALKAFYSSILNFEILGSFVNHNGYDGVFIGKKDTNWHLEFTQTNEIVTHVFDEDDNLVFYPEFIKEYTSLIDNLFSKQIEILKPKNPYWIENGIMIADPDGYKIIISNLKCKT